MYYNPLIYASTHQSNQNYESVILVKTQQKQSLHDILIYGMSKI